MPEIKIPAGQPTPATGYASPEALAGAGLRLVTKHEAANMLAVSHETLKKAAAPTGLPTDSERSLFQTELSHYPL